MPLAMHRQAFAFLPSLYRSDVPFKVSGNLLPGIEAIFSNLWVWGCPRGWGKIGHDFVACVLSLTPSYVGSHILVPWARISN